MRAELQEREEDEMFMLKVHSAPILTVVLSTALFQSPPLLQWQTPQALREWLGGKDAKTVALDNAGITVFVNEYGRPNTLYSPPLKIPATLFDTVRVHYFVAPGPAAPHRFLIAWLDDKRDEAAAEKCAVTAPVIQGAASSVDIRLYTSSCWTESTTVQRLALNLDGGAIVEGIVKITGIDLRETR